MAKKKLATGWIPTADDVKAVAMLAELGWPNASLADYFGVSAKHFGAAMVNIPALKEAYDRGVEFKNDPGKKKSWYPCPDDLKLVQKFAAEGLTVKAISSKLGISSNVLAARLEDTPLLREALDIGEGQHQAEILEQYTSLRRDEDRSLQWMTGAVLAGMKMYCGMKDKPDPGVAKSEPVIGQVKGNIIVNLPGTVKTEDFAAVALIEMQRSADIREAKKLQIVKAEYTEVRRD